MVTNLHLHTYFMSNLVFVWLRLFMEIYSDRCEPIHTDSISIYLSSCRMPLCGARVYRATKIQIILFNVLVFGILFYFSDCACAGKMPPGYMSDSYNSSLPFNPIATNGEPFPWFLPNLPNNVRPIRYALTIHPNLTTLDVKGKK